MLHFAAILDINYLGRLMGLYDSMSRHHKHFVLYIVCLDDKLHNHLSDNNLRNTVVIPVKEIEAFYPELLLLKKERSPVDYIFTLSPYYPSFILQKYSEIPFICSLDVDQYFFSSSDVVFEQLEQCSVLITPHRFCDKIKHLEAYGKYNVSFQVFKNDSHGRGCLKLWRHQCYSWCKDVLEDDKFADQKYLDTWQQQFGDKVQPIKNVGLGLAPLNFENYTITIKNNTVFIDEEKLILYHYQGLRFMSGNLINSGMATYKANASKALLAGVLQPIVSHLVKTNAKAQKDSIGRIVAVKGKGFLNRINSEGFYMLLGKRLISLDRLYYFNNKRKEISGLFNRS